MSSTYDVWYFQKMGVVTATLKLDSLPYECDVAIQQIIFPKIHIQMSCTAAPLLVRYILNSNSLIGLFF